MTEQEIDALYPCQQPCDSFGVCDNCCEKKTFKAGYQAAMKENEKLKKEVDLLEGFLNSVLMYCGQISSIGGVSLDMVEELKKLRGEK